ncbi:MAG: hypothetical protein H0U73_05120 [Tatlockia sp.]|nr:hypothetical protein [Tatlockia sp.]
MFAVIYRFELKKDQEEVYQECWAKISDYFIMKCGALGSCLHKGKDGLWVAYSRWPDKETRDLAWPGENAPNIDLPSTIVDTILIMQKIKKENYDLRQYEEIGLEVVSDT